MIHLLKILNYQKMLKEKHYKNKEYDVSYKTVENFYLEEDSIGIRFILF